MEVDGRFHGTCTQKPNSVIACGYVTPELRYDYCRKEIKKGEYITVHGMEKTE